MCDPSKLEEMTKGAGARRPPEVHRNSANEIAICRRLTLDFASCSPIRCRQKFRNRDHDRSWSTVPNVGALVPGGGVSPRPICGIAPPCRSNQQLNARSARPLAATGREAESSALDGKYQLLAVPWDVIEPHETFAGNLQMGHGAATLLAHILWRRLSPPLLMWSRVTPISG